MVYPYKPPLMSHFETFKIAQAGTAETIRFCPGYCGKIKTYRSVLGGALSGADGGISLNVVDENGVSTDVTPDLTLTQSGSAAGDIDEADATAGQYFLQTDYIEIVNDGAATGTDPVYITLEMQVA